MTDRAAHHFGGAVPAHASCSVDRRADADRDADQVPGHRADPIDERLDVLVRYGSEGLWDWTIATDEVYYSPRWQEMLGLASEPLAPRLEEWLDRVHPDDAGELRARLDACSRGEAEELDCGFRMRHADGSCRWMRARGAVTHDDTGAVRRLAGVLEDVTDRKRYEHILQRHSAAGVAPLALDPIACVTSHGILELVEENLDSAIRLRQSAAAALGDESNELVRRLVDGNRQVRGLVRWLIQGLLT